ncbi:hypothetical protein [Mycobacterium sp. 050134]|uniref:hypothetical protein n=1 Tax=Mycobacterium sp. 050134 TaxID=3096111 RepID=UPI002ED8C4E6
MNSPASRDELHQKIDALGMYEIAVVNEFVDALLTPVAEQLLDGSWLTTSEWSKAFLARLRAHHALSREPLSTTQFEAAFENACEAAGWTVESATSATQRFFDSKITIPGQPPKRISLKATSARAMSRRYVHISKLTEAAWIQDVRRQVDRRDRIVELFREYREACDAIVILRGFEGNAGVLYELIEIPTDLFAPADYLDTATAQLATIPIPPDSDHPYMKIRIDRSDSKITVTQVLLTACAVHGRWALEAQ